MCVIRKVRRSDSHQKISTRVYMGADRRNVPYVTLGRGLNHYLFPVTLRSPGTPWTDRKTIPSSQERDSETPK